MPIRLFLFFSFFCIHGFLPLFAQQQNRLIKGQVQDSKKDPVAQVNISVQGSSKGTVSDSEGKFEIAIVESDQEKYLLFRHIQFIRKSIPISSISDGELIVILEDTLRVLDQVNVTDERIIGINENVSTFKLNPLDAVFAPSPFQDISALLITLPGVLSNNELSSGYYVRGGNFDENLVYVNNFPIYRPQIITSGQQEGLSFVNVDLVKSIEFSSGGWESKYGDGLASTLNIEYKEPKKFGGSLEVGLLGGSIHIEGSSQNKKLSGLIGARYKSSAYLLNTLETQGEYKPKFADIQGYFNYDISKKGKQNETEVGLLFSYAQNRYLVEPSSRESTFGTFNNQLRLYVAFDGRERLDYNTWQGGVRLSHRFTKKWRSHFIVSGTYSTEREYYDIESGYLLCNVDNNPSSAGFNECLTNIGIGTNYYSGRNMLDATLLNVESRNEVIISDKSTMEFGIGYAHHSFDDMLNEYEFVDSSDYVTITDAVNSDASISYSRIQAYWQTQTNLNSNHSLSYGFRMLFQDFNEDLLISPRIQYSWKPERFKNTYFRASAGLYQQAPLYREFRNPAGEINEKLKAQSSVHTIAGMDVIFSKWGRPFKFTTEAYYKYLWNVNPYDIENVRIGYYGDNNAVAYATGIDFRLSGEFIPGDESWFSLGFLSTKEDLDNDNRGYLPRPTDQRVNVGFFFQDHIPGNPTLRVHLRLLYSTGLPFSPPVNPDYRNVFRGSEYQRIDIGFSKIFNFEKRNENSVFKSLWLSAEILNLTGHQNTISYYWVNDVNGNYYAVPNSLSQRFFNIRANLKF